MIKLAKEDQFKSLSFFRTFNFPNKEGITIVIKTVINFLKNNMNMKVSLCDYKIIG